MTHVGQLSNAKPLRHGVQLADYGLQQTFEPFVGFESRDIARPFHTVGKRSEDVREVHRVELVIILNVQVQNGRHILGLFHVGDGAGKQSSLVFAIISASR